MDIYEELHKERKNYLLYDNRCCVSRGKVTLTQEQYESICEAMNKFGITLISDRLPDGSIIEYIV